MEFFCCACASAVGANIHFLCSCAELLDFGGTACAVSPSPLTTVKPYLFCFKQGAFEVRNYFLTPVTAPELLRYLHAYCILPLLRDCYETVETTLRFNFRMCRGW